MRPRFALPYLLPVFAFGAAILCGAAALALPGVATRPVSLVDAFFTATSAVCVTGLAPFDIFAVYTRAGQWIILLLVQLGGLGVLTCTTLLMRLLRRRISLTDAVALEQSLFYNPDFRLGVFLGRLAALSLAIELAGAALIFLCLAPADPFDALFLAVSAFCNAGFAPWADSLERFSAAYAFNGVIMGLVILGGLGFFVLDEVWRLFRERLARLFRRSAGPPPALSFYSRVVLKSTLWLILGGGGAIFLIGLLNPAFSGLSPQERACVALFEAVTSRTAGFATVSQGVFSTATLFFVIFLMLVGGSPGSCAGGLKTTTCRILLGHLRSRLSGGAQVSVDGRAIAPDAVGRALALFTCSALIIFAASFLLLLLEQGATPHLEAPPFMDIFFEVVSAFCTVGLSLDLTPALTDAGKLLLCAVMFAGRIGLLWFISAIRQFQNPVAYRLPEDSLPVG